MKKKYTVEQLKGRSCRHGSPGYSNPEVIKAIVPYNNGNHVNVIADKELWTVQFKSGCFTILTDEALQLLLKEGECAYTRAAGFPALEVIEMARPVHPKPLISYP